MSFKLDTGAELTAISDLCSLFDPREHYLEETC